MIRTMRSFCFSLVVILAMAVNPACADKVDESVQKGVKFLVRSQNEQTGAFDGRNRHYPMTALALMAMAAVGLSTNLKDIKSMGYKPFIVGFIAMITVGLVSITTMQVFTKIFIS